MTKGRLALVVITAALTWLGSPALSQSVSPCDSEGVVPGDQQELRADCESLWEFYLNLDDPGKLDDPGPGRWGPDTPLRAWRGVSVEGGRVSELWLGHNGLIGQISPTVGSLTNLTYLDLRRNELTGPIPTELAQLTNLTYLDLRQNQLTGPIPTELAQLTNLGWLSLSYNQLSGPIPTQLAQLTNLRTLWLGNNELTGPIPTELAQLTNLGWLWLSYNQLSGPIPPELAELTNLIYLDLSQNQLTGPIPTQLGNLIELQSLELYGNQLTGPIPPELGRLTNLTSLRLGGDQAFGPFRGVLKEFSPYGSDPLHLVVNPDQYRRFTLSSEVWEVWLCDTPSRDVLLESTTVVALLNREVAPYFRWLSNGRYRPSFVFGGRVSGSGRPSCESAAKETPTERRLLVTDDTNYAGGYASGGAVVVGGGSVVKAGARPRPVLATVTHEIGHAMGFPHSFGGDITWSGGEVLEGNNPMDVVSGQVDIDPTTGTIAVNRYAAGWIDPINVVVHPPGVTADYELRPQGPVVSRCWC